MRTTSSATDSNLGLHVRSPLEAPSVNVGSQRPNDKARGHSSWFPHKLRVGAALESPAMCNPGLPRVRRAQLRRRGHPGPAGHRGRGPQRQRVAARVRGGTSGRREYVGVDIEAGPGVDQVCNAEELVRPVRARRRFDLVICTEMLEHVRDWRVVDLQPEAAASRRAASCWSRPVRSASRYHAFPWDFWRYENDDMRAIFSDLIVENVESDPTAPGVFMTARRGRGLRREGPLEHTSCTPWSGVAGAGAEPGRGALVHQPVARPSPRVEVPPDPREVLREGSALTLRHRPDINPTSTDRRSGVTVSARAGVGEMAQHQHGSHRIRRAAAVLVATATAFGGVLALSAGPAVALDPLPSVSVTDASIHEGDSGTRIIRLMVNLEPVGPTTASRTHWATAGGTATSGVDFKARHGRKLYFKPGQVTRYVKVDREAGRGDRGGRDSSRCIVSGVVGAHRRRLHRQPRRSWTTKQRPGPWPRSVTRPCARVTTGLPATSFSRSRSISPPGRPRP